MPIDPDEPLARFLFDKKKDFKRSIESVRHGAFMPRDGETSVYRVASLSSAEIWQIGYREVAPTRVASLKARAELLAEVPLRIGLAVLPDEPPENHANLTEWPEEIEEQIGIAQELAAEAELILVP